MMKKRLLVLLTVSLTACGLLSGQTRYPPVAVDMQLQQVSPHVYYVQGKAGIATDNKGFISNAGAIITDEGIILFDALGSPSLAEKFLQLIRTKSQLPIKKVFVSHYHADHIYGLQVFKETGAEIIGPQGALQYLASDNAEKRLAERRKSLAPWINLQTKLIAPDVLVDKDQQFSLGDLDFEVTYFGSAHSHGDLALYAKQNKVLFSGDLIFTGRIPFVGGDDIDNWIRKIDTIAQSDTRWVIPGHGAAFQDKPRGVQLTRDYLVLLRDSMRRAAEELIPFDEAYAAVDWHRFENLPAFKRANRQNAYRVYLAMEARSL